MLTLSWKILFTIPSLLDLEQAGKPQEQKVFPVMVRP
jgi:hypothetical protein